MITILDYSVNNLRSVQKAFEHLGFQTLVTSDAKEIAGAQKLVLPGVGAFGEAMRNLRARDLVEPVRKFANSGKPILGVCLGMQLLFDQSEELGNFEGLGLLSGKVVKFAENLGVKIPHMGWSALDFPRPSRLFSGLNDREMCYFVHSYHVEPQNGEIVVATGHHGADFVAGVENDNIMGAQFHPEKSSSAGLAILRNFAALAN